MTCAEVLATLAERLARTLPGGSRAAGSAHLLACRPCGAYARAYARTVALARAAHADAPAPFDEDLVRAIVGLTRR